MSAPRKGSKLNKTKRGGERVFTEPEQILAESKTMGSYHDQHDSNQPSAEAVAQQRLERKEMKQDKKKEVKEESSEEEEEVASTDPTMLSRKQTEELAKERAKEMFWKNQAAGKTDQAKGDLARLAVIKKQREEAARRRTEDQEAKQTSSVRAESINAGRGIIGKTLGK